MKIRHYAQVILQLAFLIKKYGDLKNDQKCYFWFFISDQKMPTIKIKI